MVNAIVPGYILACMSKGLSAWTKGGFCCKDNQTIEGRGLGSVSIALGRTWDGNNMRGASIYMSLSPRVGSYIMGTLLPVGGGILETARIHLGSNL